MTSDTHRCSWHFLFITADWRERENRSHTNWWIQAHFENWSVPCWTETQAFFIQSLQKASARWFTQMWCHSRLQPSPMTSHRHNQTEREKYPAYTTCKKLYYRFFVNVLQECLSEGLVLISLLIWQFLVNIFSKSLICVHRLSKFMFYI